MSRSITLDKWAWPLILGFPVIMAILGILLSDLVVPPPVTPGPATQPATPPPATQPTTMPSTAPSLQQ